MNITVSYAGQDGTARPFLMIINWLRVGEDWKVGQSRSDAATLNTIKSKFGRLMKLANNHDFKALHGMFWQSPSTLLVAKSAIPSEGNWAGFWGNEAVDQKLHDIGSSGPVVLEPDYSKLKVVGLTRDVAESYVPMNITVSYGGQPGRF